MKSRSGSPEEQLAALRRSFDESFASPPAVDDRVRQNMLAIRAGGRRLVVPVARLAGVEARRKIVALPGASGGLLGVAGVRRRLVAVYGLAELLGEARGQTEPRWFLLVGRNADTALAIEELVSYLQVDDSVLRPAAEAAAGHRYVREVLARGTALWSVLDVPLVLEDLARARPAEGLHPLDAGTPS
ncbi:MAG TPA: chemotaxis protein CheW [Polyangia bacterium]|nr:chemotaxis protein CheW [Polyangia bacterium]